MVITMSAETGEDPRDLEKNATISYVVVPYIKPQDFTYKAVSIDYDVEVDARIPFMPDVILILAPVLQRNYLRQQTPHVEQEEVDMLAELANEAEGDIMTVTVMNGEPEALVFDIPLATLVRDNARMARFGEFLQTKFLAGGYRPLLGTQSHDYYTLAALDRCR